MMDLRKNNKGFALILTLIILLPIIIFISAYLNVVGAGNIQASTAANTKRAYYTAEAGLADAYERIVNAGATLVPSSTCTNLNAPSLKTCTSPYIPAANTDTGVYTIGTNSGSYVVSVQYSIYPESNYIITSQGTYGKATKTLQLQINSSTFAKFAYMSNTEINPSLGALWWISGMLTSGPVQTAGQFNIFGNPVFNGQAAESNLTFNVATDTYGTTPTSSTPNYYYGTGTNPASTTTSDPSYIFPDGLTNQATPIKLPPPTILGDFQTDATNNGLTLTGASTIIFNPTGTITVTGNVVNSSCGVTTAYHNTTISVPTNGVIYVQSTKTISACHSSATDGNVTVQGTVKGQLTVAADQNVYISGNVQYNTNPLTNPSSTDMLGLVANDNVTVIEADAPAQLAIQGVLVALQGSFDVDQYSKNPDPISGGLDGANMSQFGGLINSYSGCTGVVNSSGKLVDGWNQLQSYDNRLLTTSPPGFPTLLNASGQGVYVKQKIAECNSGVCG
jgi:Tfp pilus assembly protein PilX